MRHGRAPLVQISGNLAGHLTACHFPEDPTTEARDEDVIMDPALKALEDVTDSAEPSATDEAPAKD